MTSITYVGVDVYSFSYWGSLAPVSNPVYVCGCGYFQCLSYATYEAGYATTSLHVGCPIPTDDVSQFDVWGTQEDELGHTVYGGYFNVRVMDGTTQPAANKYTGRIVREFFSENRDYCYEWFQGLYYLPPPPQGDEATLDGNNSYADFIGTTRDWIDYYAANAEGNCWCRVQQNMSISPCTSGGSWTFYESGRHLQVVGVMPSPPTYGVQRENSYDQTPWPWPY